jgi:hypothetical protein
MTLGFDLDHVALAALDTAEHCVSSPASSRGR